jgi:hypothetical protein
VTIQSTPEHERSTGHRRKTCRPHLPRQKKRSGIRSFVLPTAIGKTEIVRDVTEAEPLAATESMLIVIRQSRSK